jgi:hypothetical protein
VTISVTRQLFTILLSVMLFGHYVNAVQWLGVVFVFAGLGLDIAAGYGVKLKSDGGWDGKFASLLEILARGVQEALAGNAEGGASSKSSTGGAAPVGRSTAGLARPGVASHSTSNSSSSNSADFVDIEGGQVAASPGSATGATRKRWAAGPDKNKAD